MSLSVSSRAEGSQESIDVNINDELNKGESEDDLQGVTDEDSLDSVSFASSSSSES